MARKQQRARREPDIRLVFLAVDESLKRWRLIAIGYHAFQPLAALHLSVVENMARRLVEEESQVTGLSREVSDEDRRRAAHTILKLAFASLRPHPPDVNPREDRALEALPEQKWPEGLPIPYEARLYLMIGYAYVWANRSNHELGVMLGYHRRTIPNMRKEAARVVAERIMGWERTAHKDGAS